MLPIHATLSAAIRAVRTFNGTADTVPEYALVFAQAAIVPDFEKHARPAAAKEMAACHELCDERTGEVIGAVAAWWIEDAKCDYKLIYTASVGWPGNHQFLIGAPRLD